MSRKGNLYGHAMVENFFSVLKTERIRRHMPTAFQEANARIDGYIHFCNPARIRSKNRSGAADAAPLLFQTKYFLYRGFFVLSVQTGAVQFAGRGLFRVSSGRPLQGRPEAAPSENHSGLNTASGFCGNRCPPSPSCHE